MPPNERGVGATTRLNRTLCTRRQPHDLPLQHGPGRRLDRAPAMGEAAEVRGRVSPGSTIDVQRLRRH
jgi:hypothetical protein